MLMKLQIWDLLELLFSCMLSHLLTYFTLFFCIIPCKKQVRLWSVTRAVLLLSLVAMRLMWQMTHMLQGSQGFIALTASGHMPC